MENVKVRSSGRPKLNYNKTVVAVEIEKYKNRSESY